MVWAMDSAKQPKMRRIAFAVGLGFLVPSAFVGCSELSGSRVNPPPMLGTQNPGAYDPYLSHNAPKLKPDDAANKGQNPNGSPKGEAAPEKAEGTATTARSTAHPFPSLSAPSGGSDAVVLQAPITLPTPSNPNPRPSAGALAAKGNLASETPSLVPSRGASTENGSNQAVAVVKAARARIDSLATYQVSMRRQERVGDVLLPEEDVLLSVRRQPKAVRLEWPSGAHKGREVIYSASENGGLLQVNMADSLVPMPRLSLPPNSPLVMKNSRHPITEAGFDDIIVNLETVLTQYKTGPSKLVYSGVETPKVVGRPCYKLTRVDPEGEHWLVYLDQQTSLPAMIQASTGSGMLLERYVFQNVRPNPADLANVAAFDVNQRWGQGGLLNRLARAGSGNAKGTADSARR